MNNTEPINYPEPKQEYKVLVRCFTYNHSKYIEDSLNGFSMQQTDFPFVCLVMDDASTDGEQDVIKKWMERECDMSRTETFDIPTSVVIIVPHKNNQSCTFAFYLLKQNLYGTGERKMKHVYPWRDKCEYEALCEGDDYWIDPLKLQKQVDILDSNPNVMMVYSNYETVDEKGNVIFRPLYENYYKKISKSGDILPVLFKSNFPLTLTTIFRKEVLQSDLVMNSPSGLDYLYFMAAAFIGDAYYFEEKMGAYRLSPNGMTQAQHKKVSDIYLNIYLYVSDKYIKGFSKKESFTSHIIIKYRIVYFMMRKAELLKLIQLDSSLLLFIPFAFVGKLLKRIVKQ